MELTQGGAFGANLGIVAEAMPEASHHWRNKKQLLLTFRKPDRGVQSCGLGTGSHIKKLSLSPPLIDSQEAGGWTRKHHQGSFTFLGSLPAATFKRHGKMAHKCLPKSLTSTSEWWKIICSQNLGFRRVCKTFSLAFQFCQVETRLNEGWEN